MLGVQPVVAGPGSREQLHGVVPRGQELDQGAGGGVVGQEHDPLQPLESWGQERGLQSWQREGGGLQHEEEMQGESEAEIKIGDSVML